MPSAPLVNTTQVYDWAAPYADFAPYRIFGGLLPLPAHGLYLLFVAVLVALFAGVLQTRLPPKPRNALAAFSVLLTFTATYVLSTRWLDDLFVNLAHPYNLWHHGLFSVSPSHMTNGTVELVYYGLLTAFAANKYVLVYAVYGLGAIIGAAHLWCFAHLFRSFDPRVRFFALTVCAAWIPVVQTWSSGYGNGLATLLYLIAAWCAIQNRTRPLAVLCCVMPLIRPDAVLYSVLLVMFYVCFHRTIRVAWFLPTLLSPLVYSGAVYLIWHQTAPTPVLFKAFDLAELLAIWQTGVSETISVYLLGTWERQIMLFFTALFAVLPRPPALAVPKRAALLLLLSTIPLLFFFRITGAIGYNPTNYRYYAPFEIVLLLCGILGMISVLGVLQAKLERNPDFGIAAWLRRNIEPEPKIGTLNLRPLARALVLCLPALFLLHQFDRIALSVRRATALEEWQGVDVGIETTFYDVSRITGLRFAGEYFAPIVPQGWAIASTEMNTFGYFGGRDVVDLWGFSNLRIARSNDKMRDVGVRRDRRYFLSTNVPIFWMRTIEPVGEFESDFPALASPDMEKFSIALWRFPNFRPRVSQVGSLYTVLRRYSVVRVHHGNDKMSLFLVRHDKVREFNDALRRRSDLQYRGEQTMTYPDWHDQQVRAIPLPVQK